jgi:hypothetical protein
MELNVKLLTNDFFDKKTSLFAFLLCHRTFSMYIYCYDMHKIGSIAFFDRIMLDFKDYLVSSTTIDWESNRELLAEMFPDLDEHIPIASYAFDSCVIFDSTLKYLITKRSEYFKEIIDGLHATLDMYIQEIENLDPNVEDIDKIISSHALFIEEVNFQNSIISLISTIGIITQEVVDEFSKMVVERPFLDLAKVDG